MAKSSDMGNKLYSLNQMKTFADAIFKGEAFSEDLWNGIVQATLNLPNIRTKIEDATNNLERIQAIGTVPMRELSNLLVRVKAGKVLKKDDRFAQILLKKGRKCSELKGKLRYYSLALLFAEKNGSLYSVINFERRIVLLQLRDGGVGINKAQLVPKLGTSSETEQVLEYTSAQASLAVDPSTLAKIAYRNEKLFSIQGPPHPKIPVAADCLKVEFNFSKGRHIIATKDLEPGTTIIVENPYVGSLERALRWNTDHCGHCFKKSFNLIPCPDCVFVMYCNEECRLAALDAGHKYECPCAAELHCLDIASDVRLAFMAICKAGPAELWKVYKSSYENPEITSGHINGFNPENGIYETDSYNTIRKLAFYEDDAEMPELAVISMILAEMLDLKTNYFHIVQQKVARKGFVEFVASQILYHLTSMKINAFGLEEVREMGQQRKVLTLAIEPISLHGLNATNVNDGGSTHVVSQALRYQDLACVVYPFISLISHSCFPNATCEHLINGRMAVITTHCVKSGEEISISYGYFHYNKDTLARQLELDQVYHFICRCVACTCDWPQETEVTAVEDAPFICSNCSATFTYFELAKNKDCLLRPENGGNATYVCRHCDSRFKKEDLIKDLKKYTKVLEDARKMICDDKSVEGIPPLIESIKYFQRNLSPPCHRLLTATNLLVLTYRDVYEELP